MKEINVRDANQQFSKIVREVAESGESVLVLRNGERAVRIVPADDAGTRRLTPAQDEAKKRLMDPANHFALPPDWKFSREEMYDEDVLRHRVVRNIWLREEQEKRKGG
jgi:prevent-host-death family protein